MHEQSNEALFVIDKTGTDKGKKFNEKINIHINKLLAKSKILKIDQILIPNSSVPGLLSRSHPTKSNFTTAEVPNSKKIRKVSKAQLALIKKIANKIEENGGKINKDDRKTFKEKSKTKKIVNVDLWGNAPASSTVGVNDADKKILSKVDGNDYLDVVKPVVYNVKKRQRK